MPRLLKTMQQLLNNFLNVVQAAHVSFLDEGTFDELATPTARGTKRLAGVDLNKVRMRQVVAAIVSLSPKPAGFTAGDLARKVCEIGGPELKPYNSRQAAYALAKVRSKSIVERIGRSRRYRATPDGVKQLAAYSILREHVIKPLLAGATRPRRRWAKTIHPLDEQSKKNPYAGKDESRLAGRKLFQRHCSECHGEAGIGTSDAPSLQTQAVSSVAPGTLLWFRKNGNLPQGMPSWSRLPDAQLWQIISYLDTIGK